MRYIVVAVVAVILTLPFALKNQYPVEVNFYGLRWSTSLIVAMFAAFLTGLGLGVALMWPSLMKLYHRAKLQEPTHVSLSPGDGSGEKLPEKALPQEAVTASETEEEI